MIYKTIAIIVSCVGLTACDWSALDKAEGHDALGAAPKADIAYPISSASLPPDALATSSSSEVPLTVADVSSSSSFVPECAEGTVEFRVWRCIDGVKGPY